MPTYEYICEKCNQKFELFQSIKEAALTVCPKDHCQQKSWGKGRVRRLIGAGAGLLFKGSGFYTTDYRSESYKAAAKKETDTKTSSSTPEKATPAKADKPAASKPTKTSA